MACMELLLDSRIEEGVFFGFVIFFNHGAYPHNLCQRLELTQTWDLIKM